MKFFEKNLYSYTVNLIDPSKIKRYGAPIFMDNYNSNWLKRANFKNWLNLYDKNLRGKLFL